MFELDTLSTLVAATLVLLLGRKLVQSVSLLKKYTIPEPVAGGLLVAVALLVLKKSVGWEVNFDMTLRDPLMLAFFATIGLNANLASLRKGGRVVGVFLVVVVGLLLMQNAIGIGMAILVVQTIFMALYAIFVTWRMMGKNYDAAVLAAGHCGFGLGATPTAIANMQAITDRFGPSHMAFLVVPMVGAFFIDIVNALVIKLYLMLPMFAG
ncbi:hypothetical protein IFF90_002741 [Salmonella enterica subsp. enterica serovar Kentucky]|nr:hypothetical protein [Salmonella enterica subsp. enterica serovar Kentucky]